MQKVICSHGFGVRADSRGLFPALAASLSEYEFITFDYNDISDTGDTVVPTLDEQARKLQAVIDQHPDGSVLLCHSQGCMIAGMVDLGRISKIVLVAPPTTVGIQRVMNTLMNQAGSEINPSGISRLPRKDGTHTLISADYLKSMAASNPIKHYETVIQAKPTLIIRATNDEVLGMTDVNQIPGATHIDINADHNFTGDSRAELTAALQDYFA